MQVHIHIVLKNETFIFGSHIAETLKKHDYMMSPHHLEFHKTNKNRREGNSSVSLRTSHNRATLLNSPPKFSMKKTSEFNFNEIIRNLRSHFNFLEI